MCTCVWSRQDVGTGPRTYSWESWPADLATCPSPHQQSQRWVHPPWSLSLCTTFCVEKHKQPGLGDLCANPLCTVQHFFPWASPPRHSFLFKTTFNTTKPLTTVRNYKRNSYQTISKKCELLFSMILLRIAQTLTVPPPILTCSAEFGNLRVILISFSD